MKALIALALVPLALPGQTTGRITVGPNVQVSKLFPTATHDEVLIDADPENPSRLIACSIYQPDHGLFSERDVVYLSNDAGKTWSAPIDVDSVAIGREKVRDVAMVDPACVFGVNGRLHFARLQVAAFWSDDFGKTWSTSSIAAPESNDRDYIVVDRSGGRYHGRVYVYAQMHGQTLDKGYMPSGITLWRSLDGGKTFERPVQRFPTGEAPGVGFHPGSSVVLTDGTWAAVFNHLQTIVKPGAQEQSHIKVITSTDGGESLNPAVSVADAADQMVRGASTMPMIASDAHSALFKDRVYVVYSDLVGGRFQVMLAYSTDKGKTWSKPRIVNDDQTYRDETDIQRNVGRMQVAVNPAGIVGVLWEDRRAVKGGRDYELRFAASLDGGDTFTPSAKVSEHARVEGPAERWLTSGESPTWKSNTAFEINRMTVGFHTIGMAADGHGAFHPIWSDNRTGVNQAWTASVTVVGSPVKFGNADLASFSDYSSKVKVELVGSGYDPETKRMKVRVRLKNLSTDTIMGTLKLRGLIMQSEATTTGTVSAIESDNRVSGSGAMWDFSAQMPVGGLPPSGTTAERTIVFEFPAIRPIGDGKAFTWGQKLPYALLRFEGQILSGKPSRTVHP